MAKSRNHIHSVVSKNAYNEKCEMCGKYYSGYKYQWIGMLTKTEVLVCKDCAYKEEYGSKNWRKQKKKGTLDDN